MKCKLKCYSERPPGGVVFLITVRGLYRCWEACTVVIYSTKFFLLTHHFCDFNQVLFKITFFSHFISLFLFYVEPVFQIHPDEFIVAPLHLLLGGYLCAGFYKGNYFSCQTGWKGKDTGGTLHSVIQKQTVQDALQKRRLEQGSFFTAGCTVALKSFLLYVCALFSKIIGEYCKLAPPPHPKKKRKHIFDQQGIKLLNHVQAHALFCFCPVFKIDLFIFETRENAESREHSSTGHI